MKVTIAAETMEMVPPRVFLHLQKAIISLADNYGVQARVVIDSSSEMLSTAKYWEWVEAERNGRTKEG